MIGDPFGKQWNIDLDAEDAALIFHRTVARIPNADARLEWHARKAATGSTAPEMHWLLHQLATEMPKWSLGAAE